jgi:hypothetical protein
VTTDLLSVWTDPDTAMCAVGTSLGIFDDPIAGTALPSESPLRDALFDVLLALVEAGQLEKRACADGRYAFRWAGGAASSAVSTAATSARLDAYVDSMPRALPARIPPSIDPAQTPEVEPPEAELGPRPWPRLVVTTAPLLLPSLSCLLAVTAFVLLGNTVGVVVLGALALVGAVGLVRRVPLAGFWTAGVVVAGLLARLS